MQWFIGINEGCPAFKQYAEMAKVAVHTALQHTSLEPHCIYDGGENEFTAWLKRRGVRIIHHQTFLYDELAQLSERRGNPELLSVARGVLLRVELPMLRTLFGFDERVLYTDCDVIFRQEVVETVAPMPCRNFAVAVESDRALPDDANTGVMWMNLPQLLRTYAKFQGFMREKIDALPGMSWDQGAYREFYRSPSGQPLWDPLPPEMNWKPYWGNNSDAKIIHFHGPKPFQRPYIDSVFPELKFLTGGAYQELCSEWDELLREAEIF